MKNLPSRRARVTSEHHAEGHPGPTSLDSERFDPNSIPSGCRAIPLANGGFALVDEDDLCRVDEYNWYKAYNKTGKTWYARAAVNSSNGRTKALMHRFLFGLSPGDRITVDHKNHDGLDNRRSCNLRLATRAQNSANTRTMRKASSKYRGAHWHSRFKKWASVMVVSNNGIATRFHFGFYDTEGEAAYAYSVAAPLLKDPEFLILEAIPDSVLPSPDRQIYVKNRVLAKIKAKLSGGKTNLRATSKYYGVSLDRRKNQWRVFLGIERPTLFLGLFSSEHEAAYAYNCGVEIYGAPNKPLNIINIENHDRAQEIRTKVEGRIQEIKRQKTYSLAHPTKT